MSLIKPRARGKHLVQHRTRLDHENNETLYAYAAFIAEEPEYVLNELIDTVLAKDKEFVKWRADHAHSYVPNSASRVRRNRATSVRHSASTVPPPPASPVPLSVS